MTDGGEPSGHLAEKGDADGAESNGPEQAVTKRRARLQRRAHRSNFEISADARQNPETDGRELFHRPTWLTWPTRATVLIRREAPADRGRRGGCTCPRSRGAPR